MCHHGSDEQIDVKAKQDRFNITETDIPCTDVGIIY